MWVWAVGVEAVLEKCGLWGKAGPAWWSCVEECSLFHHPSHKPWFIWTEQLHRPTTLIHWPSRNPGDRGGPEKNGVVRLVIPSTSTRFTSTALYNVYPCEEGQKIKTFLAFATLSHYANLYISQRGDHHFIYACYQFLSCQWLSVLLVLYQCHKCFQLMLQ